MSFWSANSLMVDAKDIDGKLLDELIEQTEKNVKALKKIRDSKNKED